MSKLANDRQLLLKKRSIRLISIDGIVGSGKTTLTERLRGDLDADVIHLDDLLNKNQGSYLAHIRYDDLETELSRLSRRHNPVLIEGVCVLRILERLSCRPDVTEYCKKLDYFGLWFDGLFLDQWRSAEEYIQHERDLQHKVALLEDGPEADIAELTGLEVDIITYHFECCPHQTAQFSFEWSTPR